VEDAADVVAETFAIAWRRLDAIPNNETSLLWLYATCRRVIANHSRREKRRVELTERIGSQLRTVVHDAFDTGDDALTAALALGRLAETDREILLLVSWEGLSCTDLAHLLGCSAIAARIRLHRARGRLTVEMEQLGIVSKQERSSRHSPMQSRLPRESTREM